METQGRTHGRRDELLEMLRQLPEDANAEDMMLELLILLKFERGEEDIRAGRVIDHDELMRQVRQWQGR